MISGYLSSIVTRDLRPTSGISSDVTSKTRTTMYLGNELPSSACRLDVLVDVEQVVGVVLRLDLGEPCVVLAVRGLDPVLSLLHHHVHVCAARGERVQRLVVLLRPGADRIDVRG